MTKPISHTIPDIQSLKDTRQKVIQQVGIRSVRHRLAFIDGDQGKPCHTVSLASLYVGLPQDEKGTHMSRFIEFLNEELTQISLSTFSEQLVKMAARLSATEGFLKLSFPWLIDKEAPLSKSVSAVDYDISIFGRLQNGKTELQIQLVIPVTTLCPCSKEISEYGAHNQRSYITLTALLDQPIALKPLIIDLENQGSCQVYSLLKRPDEKYVTEYAYDHPKFVEDLVRDLATVLDQYPEIKSYRVESENIESIHNHTAYAMIQTGDGFIDIR